MPDSDIRVLVVEDEAIAAEAHTADLGRLTGFVHAGTASDGQTALRLLSAAASLGKPIDLVLMDLTLPDLQVVRGAVAAGIVQYLIKPFTYATFAQKLAQYRDFRLQLGTPSALTSQTEIDQAFASLRTPSELPRPKGLAEGTLAAVVDFVKSRSQPISSSEVMDELGMSRVTARRYLDFLADSGSVLRTRGGARVSDDTLSLCGDLRPSVSPPEQVLGGCLHDRSRTVDISSTTGDRGLPQGRD
ncbi:response regulator [Cryobacterium fucosi]|uniref:DeoR family transcriptional regulator n=1 Tax=Cryobacterium fucosi TaxID=1259157 RepID=A0A4R9B878_9MICO|nr:DeoR family transcriptional regulator [Cryobacterium fucosi]